MSKHTPEPWWTERDPSHFHTMSSISGGAPDKGGIRLSVAEVGGPTTEEQEANAARIVACVNALADRDPSKLADLEKEMECAIACLSAIGATRPADNLAAALAAFRKEVQS